MAEMIERKAFYSGLDLGMSQDFSALVVLEKTSYEPPPGPRVEEKQTAAGRTVTVFDHRPRGEKTPPGKAVYRCQYLIRWDLGTPYTKVVEDVVGLYARPPLAGSTLAVDQTGVGDAVVDMFNRARSHGLDAPGGGKVKLQASVRPIRITAGSAVTAVGAGWHVAKKELVSVLQVLLQPRRLLIAKALPHAGILVQELENFRVKVNPVTANESFEAWRENAHDDLVLATALAAWVGERGMKEVWIR